MVAEKGNKVYIIDETSQKKYQQEGFDIKDNSGNIILYGKGKTVSMDEHIIALKEIGQLREKLAELQQAEGSEEPEMEEGKEEKTVKKANSKQEK